MCSMYLTFYIALNHKIGFALNIFVLVSSSFFFIETTISTLLPHLVIICVALVACKEKVAWDPSIWLLWFFLLLDIKYWAHPSLSNEGRPFFHHTLSDLNVTHLYLNFHYHWLTTLYSIRRHWVCNHSSWYTVYVYTTSFTQSARDTKPFFCSLIKTHKFFLLCLL